VDVDYETVEIKHTLDIGDLGFKKHKVFDSTFDNISLPKFSKNTFLHDKFNLRYVHKNGNLWSVKSLELRHKNAEVLQNLQLRLEHILEQVRIRCQRPKRLLAFINPFGGKGEAVRLNADVVQPLLNSCQVDCQVVITERAYHARDLLLDCNLDGIDGIICIGGDGMFSELFNGLLLRTARTKLDKDLNSDPKAEDWIMGNNMPKPDIRLGVIPGGSTDAVAMSLHGTNDVVTAALHIVLGDQRHVDVTSVCSGGKFERFSLAMVSYGYFGDLMKRSEKYRWLGPKRYDISGVRTFLGK